MPRTRDKTRERRTARIETTVTDRERELIEDAARKAGWPSMSSYVRIILLEKHGLLDSSQ
jgi:uncharacterized protein (DUF1778 family)